MTRLLSLLAALAACAPSTAAIDTGVPDDPADPGDPDSLVLSCDEAPASVAGLDAVPVTVFYEGQLAFPDVAEYDTVFVETPIQREWSTVEMTWAPEGADFGSLDDDSEFAGHGVLAAAYRRSTCGMEVQDIRAWRLPDEAGTTYVELTIEDSSGGCDTACSMEEWVGAAFAVPIADFPFSGPVVGCVEVIDGCE